MKACKLQNWTIAGLLLVGVAPVWALTLVSNPEDLNDGILSGSAEQILSNQADNVTFWWDDADGNGVSGDSVSAGLDMAGKTLQRAKDTVFDNAPDMILNLGISGTPGNITNFGTISTSLGQFRYSGTLTITNAGHITLETIDMKVEGGGGAVISHTGNLTVTNAIFDCHRGDGSGNSRSFLLDGHNGGSLNIGNGIIRVMSCDDPLKNLIIQNYTGVQIDGGTAWYDKGSLGDFGEYGINADGGWDGCVSSVIITNIGLGGVTVTNGISTRSARNPNNRAISIQTSGSVNVGNLHTYGVWQAGYYAGDIRVTAGGDIAVTGTINANNNFQDANDGILSLSATGAASRITLGDLDVSLFRSATLAAGGGFTFITNSLLNFPTNAPGNGRLNAGAGQIISYNPALAANAYLTNGTSGAATLCGSMESTGGAPTEVYVYWGENSTAWANTNYLGTNGIGFLSKAISGLSPETRYFYRFFATNSFGGIWAPTTNSFVTPLPVYQYKMKILFSGYNKTEVLTNFPVLVVISNNMNGLLYSQFISTNGWDLRFMNSDETRVLNYEIES